MIIQTENNNNGHSLPAAGRHLTNKIKLLTNEKQIHQNLYFGYNFPAGRLLLWDYSFSL